MTDLEPTTESNESLALAIAPAPTALAEVQVDRRDPNLDEDWYEAALSIRLPAPPPVRSSWGDDDETEEELPEEDEDVEEDEADPFEDFDEEDFDDDFDDDFEEELEDEYEIEPADDGMLEGHPDAENIDDEELDGDDAPIEFTDEE